MRKCTKWSQPFIMVSGHVVPCCSVMMSDRRSWLKENSMGNILDQPFSEIWNSEKYRLYRKSIPDDQAKVPLLCKGCRAYNTKDREALNGIFSI